MAAGRSAYRSVMLPETLNSDHGHCRWFVRSEEGEKGTRIEALQLLGSSSCRIPATCGGVSLLSVKKWGMKLETFVQNWSIGTEKGRQQGRC